MNVAAGLALILSTFVADSYSLGRWTISAPASPDSSCMMFTSDLHIAYGFSFRKPGGDKVILDLWLGNEAWDFTVGETKWVRVEFGGLGGTMKGEAISKNSIDIPIDATQSVVLAAMLAPSMKIETGRGTVVLSLAGSRAAMEEIRACTERAERGEIGAYGGQLF